MAGVGVERTGEGWPYLSLRPPDSRPTRALERVATRFVTGVPYAAGAGVVGPVLYERDVEPRTLRHEQEHVNQFYSHGGPSFSYDEARLKKFFSTADMGPRRASDPLGDSDYWGYRFRPTEMAAAQAEIPGPQGGWHPEELAALAWAFTKAKGGSDLQAYHASMEQKFRRARLTAADAAAALEKRNP